MTYPSSAISSFVHQTYEGHNGINSDEIKIKILSDPILNSALHTKNPQQRAMIKSCVWRLKN